MPVSRDYQSFVAELVEPLGRVRIRRMFGGAGLFLDDVMFGLIADDVLYLKVDEATRADYEGAGKGPFRYQTKSGARALTSYYEVPEALFEAPDDFLVWARRAADAALAGAGTNPARRRAAEPRAT